MSNRRSRRTRRNVTNRNSRIISQPRSNTLYARTTFTKGRDEGSLVAAMNTESNNVSNLILNRSGTTVVLSGHEARTLFRVLEAHYFGA